MDERRKLRIMHVIEGLGSGGAERLLYTNLKNLVDSPLINEVVTVFPQQDYWRESIEGLGIPVKSLDCAGYRNLVSGCLRLRGHIRLFKPDIIHTHLWAANIAGRIAGRAMKVPVISSIHNPEYEPEVFVDAEQLSHTKLFVSRILDKATSAFGCRRMIAVSEYVKEHTFKRIGYPREQIDVLYNPIEISELHRTKSRHNLLRELGLKQHSLVILNIGRVSPQKGLIYAIRSMPEILRTFPTAHLVSVGGQSDKGWLSVIKNEIESLHLKDKITLAGERRDVPDVLFSSDVFIFPSLFEGLGIAVAEAMAAELACIASDIGPIPEFIKGDVNGVLVPPRDPHAIAKAICLLLGDNDMRQRLGKAARRTALDLFEPQAAAKRLTEIYCKVANRDVVRDN